MLDILFSIFSHELVFIYKIITSLF